MKCLSSERLSLPLPSKDILSSKVAISQVWLFKFRLNQQLSFSVWWAMFQVPNSPMGLVALSVDSTDTEHFHHDRKLCWTELVGSNIPSQFPPITWPYKAIFLRIIRTGTQLNVSSWSLPTGMEPSQGRASALFTSISQDRKWPGVEQALGTYLLDRLVFQECSVSKWSG